jgi:glycosyltransferase involved in cell wall biosynthesis
VKVAIGVHHFPPRYVGGAEQHAVRIASGLAAAGHEARVVCVERIDAVVDGLDWVDDVFAGVAVRRLSFNRNAVPDPVRFEYDNAWIGEHVKNLLTTDPPDVFHLIGGYLLSGSVLRAARDLGIPSVVSLTDFWFLCPRFTMLRSDGSLASLPLDPVRCARCLGEERRRYRLPARLFPGLMQMFWRRRHGRVRALEERSGFLRRELSHVEAIISPSEFVRAVHVSAGIDPGRFICSRQGLEISSAGAAVAPPSPRAPLRIGYLGQIAWHKGVHVLLEAVRRLPDAAIAVSVYGDDTAFPAYAAQLRRLAASDTRVALGKMYRSGQELQAVLGQLDVVVVPSVWYENSPTVILEAFGHGVPVIATDLGGMAELVRDGEDGLLFPRGDVDALARQLQRLIDDPALLRALRAGVKPVRSWSDELRELLDIYDTIRRRRGVMAARAG